MLSFTYRQSSVQDSELIEYLSESCVMSKSVDDYGERKSSAITTARRLAAFLGDDRLKDKGLVCNYVIAQYVSRPFLRPKHGHSVRVSDRPSRFNNMGLPFLPPRLQPQHHTTWLSL